MITYLAGFSENDDIISFGRLDVRPDVAELVVRDPARRLGVVRRRLRQHLLAVQRQVLEVRITREWTGEIRHDGGCLVRDDDKEKVEEKIDRSRTLSSSSSPRTDSHTTNTMSIVSFRLTVKRAISSQISFVIYGES